MDEIRKSILRKIEAIERADERANRHRGIIRVQMEGEEARDFEAWRAARAEALGLPAPDGMMEPDADPEPDPPAERAGLFAEPQAPPEPRLSFP